MPKLTIYLPDHLAAEVKAAGISVSPICQRALEEEVRMTQTTKIADSEISEAAKRLVAEEAEEVRQARKEGRRDGRFWALKSATPTELRRMQSVLGSHIPEVRIRLYEARGVSEYENASFETIRQMIQDSDPPPDFGDEAILEYWDAFEDSAMIVYDEVMTAMAQAERAR